MVLETLQYTTSKEDFTQWERELNSPINVGGVVLDFSGIDFTAIAADMESIDVDRVILEEFQKSFKIESTDANTPRRTIQEVVSQVEFFLSQPVIQSAMRQLDYLARRFAHLCSGADGHGGFLLSQLGGNAKNFYEQGLHSLNDGHNHASEAVNHLRNTNSHSDHDHATNESDKKRKRYKRVKKNGKWVKVEVEQK
jgi:hypothetical protein